MGFASCFVTFVFALTTHTTKSVKLFFAYFLFTNTTIHCFSSFTFLITLFITESKLSLGMILSLERTSFVVFETFIVVAFTMLYQSILKYRSYIKVAVTRFHYRVVCTSPQPSSFKTTSLFKLQQLPDKRPTKKPLSANQAILPPTSTPPLYTFLTSPGSAKPLANDQIESAVVVHVAEETHPMDAAREVRAHVEHLRALVEARARCTVRAHF